MQDYGFIDQYHELVETIAKMIRADKSMIPEEHRWLPITGSDINGIYDAGDSLSVAGSTFTMQAGGSDEYWSFDLLKSDLELFQLKQKLGGHDTHREKIANTISRDPAKGVWPVEAEAQARLS